MAYAIENWRDNSGKHINDWLAIVGEFEALCSLATFAFENPAFPYPVIEETGVLYHGKKLAHPLLPRGKAVPNDITLDPDNQVLIISGSNMSGKSTFLRTLGINAVLAFAGSPVMAESLKISTLTIAATLRIQDSLQEGKSRFYAEILRVRQVVDLSKATTPLFFLLDEIFAGTNSSDRRLGAEAVVRSLVNTGAIGLVTTHDLTLTRIGDNLGSLGKNAHFADYFEEGVMKFDYKLHPGVVQNSNAIALMRAVGLDL
ncbi:MAG: MutS-related protein [Gemmataceae bacterium]